MDNLKSPPVVTYRVSGGPCVFPHGHYLWHPWSDQTHISHVEQVVHLEKECPSLEDAIKEAVFIVLPGAK